MEIAMPGYRTIAHMHVRSGDLTQHMGGTREIIYQLLENLFWTRVLPIMYFFNKLGLNSNTEFW